MKSKPYKARTIKSDERRVRLLQNHIDELHGIANRDRQERNLMTKLAATRPAFYNPLEAMVAEQLRDIILRDHTEGPLPSGRPKKTR